MSDPPLNIDYWSSLYQVYEEDNEQYEKAIQETELVEKARQLWQWKDLSRSIPFKSIDPILSDLDMDEYVDNRPEVAVQKLLAHLQNEEIIKGDGLVTPAFLLHLATSDATGSSKTFPIYDRRVWNAYVYLWRLRGKGDQLYRAASTSPGKYGDFCRDFADSCPDNSPREYEQALFMFGGYIMDLAEGESPTAIDIIDSTLSSQEQALQTPANYSMVDIDRIKNTAEDSS